MLFTSPEFLLAFLPLTLLGFHLLRLAGRPQFCVPWLFVASMVFYAWWSPRFLLLLIISMLVNWGDAHAMARQHGLRRKAFFILGLIWNLGILAYFKYADFFISSLDAVAHADWPLLHIVLPLGISFFTFQKIAYLADIHAGYAKPGPLVDFALFVFFFPQLIAGPIVHHSEVMPQFRAMAGKKHDKDFWLETSIGLTLLLIGLVKKVCIADQLAPYATNVFDHAAQGSYRIGLLAAWQGALAYTVELYTDFSGYSDMAIGLARMFGVKLPANFNSPYKSTSIIEFWRRWHMTLSRFLRDYLYVPLGGNRKGSLRRYLNLMVTMLLGGLWHGAGWTYVAWGGLHGLYLLVNHGWRNLGKRALPPLPAWLLTLLAVITGLGVFSRERFFERGEHRQRPVRAEWRGRSHPRRQESNRPPARSRRACRDRDPAQLPTDHAALHAGARAGGPAARFHWEARLGSLANDGDAQRRRDHRRRALLLGHDGISLLPVLKSPRE